MGQQMPCCPKFEGKLLHYVLLSFEQYYSMRVLLRWDTSYLCLSKHIATDFLLSNIY